MIAQSLARSKYLALGGFYRRVRGRRGGQFANIAAARKLAVLFYNTLRRSWKYVEQGLVAYEKQYKEQYLKRLKAAAKRFGMFDSPTELERKTWASCYKEDTPTEFHALLRS